MPPPAEISFGAKPCRVENSALRRFHEPLHQKIYSIFQNSLASLYVTYSPYLYFHFRRHHVAALVHKYQDATTQTEQSKIHHQNIFIFLNFDSSNVHYSLHTLRCTYQLRHWGFLLGIRINLENIWFLFHLYIYSILQYKDLAYVEFVESEMSLFIQYTYYERGK